MRKTNDRLLDKIVDSKASDAFFSYLDSFLDRMDDVRIKHRKRPRSVKMLGEKAIWLLLIIGILWISLHFYTFHKETKEIIQHNEENIALPFLEEKLDIPKEKINITLQERPIIYPFLYSLNIEDASKFVYEVSAAEKGQYLFTFNINSDGKFDHFQLIPLP